MKLNLCHDTETNGIPEWSTPSEDPCQPRITQLAAVLQVEETREVLGAINFLIKPDGWTILDDVAEKTGITTEKCERFGVPIEHALHAYMELWKLSDQRVGHNESFDARMLRHEIKRHPFYSMQMIGEQTFADYFKAAPAFCTMRSSTNIVKAPNANGRGGFKWPKLEEAYCISSVSL